MVADTGREIANEEETAEAFFINIKQGDFLVFLGHINGTKYMEIIFRGVLPEEMRPIIHQLLTDQVSGAQRAFGFFSVISNPLTGYRLNREGDVLIGFEIVSRIYPLEPSFSMRSLDAAIQSVTSIGVLTLQYLSFMAGETQMEQQIVDTFPQTSPDGMYV